MAAPWLLLLKAVPWTEVVKATPIVVEGAEKLWKTIRKKPDQTSGTVSQKDNGSPASSAGDHLEKQAQAIAELQGVMVSASELIKALADQNANLVARLEKMRRCYVLGWFAVGLSALSLLLVLRQG